MAVERDRYYGAAIDKHGKLAEHAAWIRPLLAPLAEVDWPALRRTDADRGRSTPAPTRASASRPAVIDPMTPVLAELLGLGPGGAAELGTDTAAIVARRWQTAVSRALELAQVPYAIVDEIRHRGGARALPRRDRADARSHRPRRSARALRALAEHKHTVIVIGPSTPTRDELDQPLAEPLPRRIGRLKDGSLDDLPGPRRAISPALAGDPPDAWQVERPDDVRTAAFADATGAARVDLRAQRCRARDDRGAARRWRADRRALEGAVQAERYVPRQRPDGRARRTPPDLDALSFQPLAARPRQRFRRLECGRFIIPLIRR